MRKKTNIEAKQKGLELEINRENLAMELKKYRLRRGLTQQELAAIWNTNRWVIIRAEGAKSLSWEQAYKIFYLLNKSIQNEPAIINPTVEIATD